MICFRESFLQRQLVLPFVIAVFVASCTTWKVQREPVQVVVAQEEPNRIRVTLLSGQALELRDPMVEASTLRGWKDVGAGRREAVGIPTDSVAHVEVRKTAVLQTVLLVAGLVVVTGAIVAALAPEPDPTPITLNCDGDCLVSCPMVYSWDGAKWWLDSGTFGGAIFEPLARTDLDNLDHATSVDGLLRLKLANELRETEHVDLLSVLAVDHAPGITIAPDGAGTPHALSAPQPPTQARDLERRNILAQILWTDGWSWESELGVRDTSRVEHLRDGIELAFARPPGATQARLLVDAHNTEWAAALVQAYVALHGRETAAWYAAMNADPLRARTTGETFAREGFLLAELSTPDGWSQRGLLREAGPEVMKRQVLPLDLAGAVGDTIRVRLTSIPSFWRIDRVAIDFRWDLGTEGSVSIAELAPRSAISRDGDDVLRPLLAIDGEEWVMMNGEYAIIEVDVPPVPAGFERTYLLRTHGWYQIDGPAGGEPATELLARVDSGAPGAVARIAVALRNEALAALASGRTSTGLSSETGGGKP